VRPDVKASAEFTDEEDLTDKIIFYKENKHNEKS